MSEVKERPEEGNITEIILDAVERGAKTFADVKAKLPNFSNEKVHSTLKYLKSEGFLSFQEDCSFDINGITISQDYLSPSDFVRTTMSDLGYPIKTQNKKKE